MSEQSGPGVKGYARALYEIAQVEGDNARVSDELYRVARAVESHTELRRTLTDIGVPFAGKEQLLQDLLGQQASPHTLNALRFVISQGKARELVEIADELSKITAEESNKELAEVRTAIPLDSEQRAALARALKEATGRNVEVKTIVDPSVIGGVLAKVGDIVIDGTVRGKLAQLKQHLGVD